MSCFPNFNDMWSEFQRYGTFAGFQAPDGVWPMQLAKAGFSRSSVCGNNEVVCLTCDLVLDVRTLGDESSFTLHQRLSPTCSFVTNSTNSQTAAVDVAASLEWLHNNYTFDSHRQNDRQPDPNQNYPQSTPTHSSNFSRSQQNQQCSFPVLNSVTAAPFSFDQIAGDARLPVVSASSIDTIGVSDLVGGLSNATLQSMSPALLAAASHNVSSFSSTLGGGDIAVDGLPMEPEGEYPNPPTLDPDLYNFVSPVRQTQSLQANYTRMSLESPVELELSKLTTPQKPSFGDLGIVIQRPKREDMAILPTRLETFNRWQSHPISQTKESIAEAGFYYAGYADCCRCFYCGGGLKNWEAEDDPWVEHARWFPDCPYLHTSKGLDFVNAVQSLHRTNTLIRMSDVETELQDMTPLDRNEEEVTQADPTMDDESESEMIDEEEEKRLENENEELLRPDQCKICLDSSTSVLFIPCGHLVTCATCAPTVNTCPVCRHIIHGQIRVQRE